MSELRKYKIRTIYNEIREIDGMPCLVEEYPDLQLWLGFYPCREYDKCNMINTGECEYSNCFGYKVNELTTGAALWSEPFETKEGAIEKAVDIINKYGIEKVKEKIGEYYDIYVSV